MPLSKAFVSTLFVTESVPSMLLPASAPLPLKAMLASPTASPELLIVPLANVKFVTSVPLIPLPPVLWMFMFVNDGLRVLLSEMPWPVVLWIVPPELSPPTDVLPLPATTRLPLAPVVLRTIPLAPPVAEIFLKLRPLGPIVVLTTLSAGPAPGVVPPIVLFEPVTLTVPPPVAENAAPELSVTPPVRLMVAPVLPLRLMPVPLSLIAPLKATVPLLRPATDTEWPALPVIGEAMLMFPPAAPDRSTPSPPALEMFTAFVVPTVAVVTATPLIASPLVPEMFRPWTSTPLARPTPVPEAFVTTGLLPPAATRLLPFTVRPCGSPHRGWLASSGIPPP